MDSETWRVVLESGEVQEAGVAYRADKRRWFVSTEGGDTAIEAPHARGAIMQAFEGCPVREILAPGEATAEERVQRAHRDGVLRGLTIAREHAVAVIDGGTGEPAIDWTDVTVATGDALTTGGAQ